MPPALIRKIVGCTKKLVDIYKRSHPLSSRASVTSLAEIATHLGDVTALIHAAGVSPSQATPETIQPSKRGNSLRVMAEAVRWGERGARVNAISPGIIITPLANDELSGLRGAGYRRMIEGCAAKTCRNTGRSRTVGALLMSQDAGIYHRQ